MNSNANSVSYILVSMNGGNDLIACINSIYEQDDPKEIIIVDNASTDKSITNIQEHFHGIHLVTLSGNRGVAEGWNIGAQHARGSVYIFITQDVVITKDFQREIQKAFEQHDRVGIVGALLLYPSKDIVQHAGAKLVLPRCITRHIDYGATYDQNKYSGLVDCDYVTGAVFGCRPDVYNKIGGFDKIFYPAYFEDVDFCYRAHKQDWHIVMNPLAIAFHKESTTLGVTSISYFRAYTRNRYLFFFKHKHSIDLLDEFISNEINWMHSLKNEQRLELFDCVKNSVLPELQKLFVAQHDREQAECTLSIVHKILHEFRDP